MADEYSDPWTHGDPWQAQHAAGYDDMDLDASSIAEQDEQPYSYAQEARPEQSTHRVVNDSPPIWDGKQPDKQAEAYLKLLDGWLATTRTLKKQQGMIIMQYAKDDLRTIINELDMDELTMDTGGKSVRDHIANAYEEYIKQPLPKAMEAALFHHDGHRKKGESLFVYASRKRTLFKDLERAKCKLPDEALGYILLRDAKLSTTAWDTITTWTQGDFSYDIINKSLRKLERPVPGHGGHHSGLNAWVGDSTDRESFQVSAAR